MVFARQGVCETVKRIRANVLRDDNEFLCNVAHCTALISTCLDETAEALFVETESDTASAGSGRPVETVGAAAFD